MIKQTALKNIQSSILILLGEKGGAFDIKKAVQKAEIFIADVTVKIIENASHLIPVSQPEVTNKEILEFLKR